MCIILRGCYCYIVFVDLTFFRGPLALPSPDEDEVVDDRRADERDLFFNEALGSFLVNSFSLTIGGAFGGGGEISFSSLSITKTTPSSVSELFCLVFDGDSLMTLLASFSKSRDFLLDPLPHFPNFPCPILPLS